MDDQNEKNPISDAIAKVLGFNPAEKGKDLPYEVRGMRVEMTALEAHTIHGHLVRVYEENKNLRDAFWAVHSRSHALQTELRSALFFFESAIHDQEKKSRIGRTKFIVIEGDHHDNGNDPA